jgi:hypothetical protein
MTYRAFYENEDIMQVFQEETDEEAIKTAQKYIDSLTGQLLQVDRMTDDYEVIENIY